MEIKLNKTEKAFSAGVKWEVYTKDCYELRKQEFERLPLHIVDLGANFGWFSRLATKLYPDSKIYAYEMVERNYLIAKHLLLSGHNNIELHNAIAIGNHKIDTIRVDYRRNLGGNKVISKDSRFYLNQQISADDDQVFSHENSIALSQYSLKNIIDDNNIDYIDFLKMDVEGSEYDILEYVFENGLSKKILNLSMEVHGRREFWKKDKGAPGDSQQLKWLKEQCHDHFDEVSFYGHYARLSNKLGK